MAKARFFRVTTSTTSYKVKAVETSKGLFEGRMIWRLYAAPLGSIFPTYKHIGDCEDLNRIGEAIRVAIPKTKKIDITKY